MVCSNIIREDNKSKNGNLRSYTYKLIKPLNNAIVSKILTKKKNSNSLKPRATAFANVTTLNLPDAAEFNEYLGKAANFDSQPQEFKDMFDKNGILKEENRHKFAYLGFLDRTNKNYTSLNPNEGKKFGTFIKNSYARNYFGVRPRNINKNETLKKYHLTNEKYISLVRGSATQLLECLMGSQSPLHKLGVEYVVLHAASRALESNYYKRKFGFVTLESVPQQEATFALLDEEDYAIEDADYEVLAKQKFLAAPEVPGTNGELRFREEAHEGKKIYFRLINDKVYTVYGTDTGGSIMYKKLEEKSNDIPNEVETNAALTNKPAQYTRKQMEKIMLNKENTKNTKKIYNNYLSKKPYYQKNTMKRRT